MITDTDPDIRKFIKKNKTAIIPVGATEQHGAHLPVSTDADIITEIAGRLAKNKRYLLLPTITYGVSYEHAPLLNLSITPGTLRRTIRDLCHSLAANGINTVFVLNGHHGNQKALGSAFTGRGMPRVFVLSYWHYMKKDLGHAGFAETSIMLAISRHVKMNRAKRGLDTNNLTKTEIQKLEKLAQKSFLRATKNGIWGNPTNATKGDGQAILSEIVSNLAKRCQTCLTGRDP
ncbi:MAG: creatininase family protein [Nitrosopumilus sp. D6]|nr:MAG: creatininase family protein [Nitrosopumilus sp. D6]